MAIGSQHVYFSDRDPSRQFSTEQEAEAYERVLIVAEFITEQSTLDIEDARHLATEMNRNGLLRFR